MPVTKSATKRARQTIKRHKRNLRVKTNMKREIRALIDAIAAGQKDVGAKVSKAQSAIDKATKAGIIHKNKAARQKASLVKQAKTKPAKSPAKKPAIQAKTAPKTTAKKVSAPKK